MGLCAEGVGGWLGGRTGDGKVDDLAHVAHNEVFAHPKLAPVQEADDAPHHAVGIKVDGLFEGGLEGGILDPFEEGLEPAPCVDLLGHLPACQGGGLLLLLLLLFCAAAAGALLFVPCLLLLLLLLLAFGRLDDRLNHLQDKRDGWCVYVCVCVKQ